MYWALLTRRIQLFTVLPISYWSFTLTTGYCQKQSSLITTRSLLFQNKMEFSSSSEGTPYSDLHHNLRAIREKIDKAAEDAKRSAEDITLVAVSKTKPVSDILTLYNAGQKHFGENYFQEITEKTAQLPNDIKWHFIGHLQSAKASKLIREVPNLHVLETLDSLKLARKVNNACETAARSKLNVYIQVDTSNEDTKSGVPPEELSDVVFSIKDECPHLNVCGLMTIGAPGDLTCFQKLVECRSTVTTLLGVVPETWALSMGMSGDFEAAIACGASSVRVGSSIFGPRIYPKTQSEG